MRLPSSAPKLCGGRIRPLLFWSIPSQQADDLRMTREIAEATAVLAVATSNRDCSRRPPICHPTALHLSRLRLGEKFDICYILALDWRGVTKSWKSADVVGTNLQQLVNKSLADQRSYDGLADYLPRHGRQLRPRQSPRGTLPSSPSASSQPASAIRTTPSPAPCSSCPRPKAPLSSLSRFRPSPTPMPRRRARRWSRSMGLSTWMLSFRVQGSIGWRG